MTSSLLDSLALEKLEENLSEVFLASLISPNSRRIKTIQMITSLEIIASLSTDAKWLSWLKYQFTEAINKNDRLDKNELHVTMEDFIQNFNLKTD